MSELLKSQNYLMKCLGFVFVFGFISLGAIGGCNNNGGGGDGGDGDGGQQPSQVASACDGLTPTIIGTNGDDNLTGTEGDDIIVGLAGNDTIDGLGGNDTICGDAGNDNIIGGPGNDVLDGGPGDDVMTGGSGDDIIVEAPGSSDDAEGGDGNDTLDFINSTIPITLRPTITNVDQVLNVEHGDTLNLKDQFESIRLSPFADFLLFESLPGLEAGSNIDVVLSGAEVNGDGIIVDGGGGSDTFILDADGGTPTFSVGGPIIADKFFLGNGVTLELLNFQDILAVDWKPLLIDDSDPQFSTDPAAGCFKSNDNQGNNGVTFCPAGNISRGSWTFENPLPSKDVTVGITYVSNPPDRSDQVYVGVLCLPAAGGEPLLLQGRVFNQQTPPIGFTLNDLDFDDIGLINTQGCKQITIEAINESINQNFFLELDSVVLVSKESFDVTLPNLGILSPQDGKTVNLEDLEIEVTVSDNSGQPVVPVTIQVPVLEPLNVCTTVAVPDGGTVLLGGIKCLDDGLKELGVPILGSIPPLKELFLDIEVSATDFAGNSIMLMVTPRLIIPEEEEVLLQ